MNLHVKKKNHRLTIGFQIDRYLVGERKSRHFDSEYCWFQNYVTLVILMTVSIAMSALLISELFTSVMGISVDTKRVDANSARSSVRITDHMNRTLSMIVTVIGIVVIRIIETAHVAIDEIIQRLITPPLAKPLHRSSRNRQLSTSYPVRMSNLSSPSKHFLFFLQHLFD